MTDTPRIEELRRRVQRDPASIAFAALAEEYRKQGRFDEAIATCTAGLTRHPAYLSAHVTLGRALLEIGRFDEAQEELEHVLRIAPENLAAIRGLAEIHHRKGQLPEVHEAFAEPTAFDLAPPEPPAPRPLQTPIPVSVAPEPPVEEPPPADPFPISAAIAAPPHPALAPLEGLLAAIAATRADRRARR
jgi:tetratricopeptide (TPR) repeat protein